ncbi:MAG: Gfo/Idh/MocA family oxidoreductase, partial [Verrucomicrobiae bacterium]|nr:Gfo/Idh/MocA family oxidoreductase [Verrucomicrobiae bacterium]
MPSNASIRAFNRRRFLGLASTVTAATVVPRRVLGGAGNVPPSDRLNVAIIGAGGQGITNLKELLRHPDVQIAALCDVAEFWDNSHLYYRHHGGRGPAKRALEEHHRDAGTARPPAVGMHVDYRRMLERSGRDIDAVLIAAPNHIHAVAARAAMQAGQGVYCEKPLTHSIHEARVILDLVKEHKNVTQMGNQIHSDLHNYRRVVEQIQSAMI